MMLTKISVISQAIVLATAIGANAQSLRNTAGPAEMPPSSFGGAQYVDSAGCVFLRAGVNGNTIWVPRVTRSRKLVCGRSPTFSAVVPATPVQVVTAEPVAVAAVVPAAQPARRPVTPVVMARTAPVVAPAVVAPNMRAKIMIPNGFRSAWNDGRLNPNRGPQSANGDAQMALVWTNTVPRRLVAQK